LTAAGAATGVAAVLAVLVVISVTFACGAAFILSVTGAGVGVGKAMTGAAS
jgi:hypothetical protein